MKNRIICKYNHLHHNEYACDNLDYIHQCLLQCLPTYHLALLQGFEQHRILISNHNDDTIFQIASHKAFQDVHSHYRFCSTCDKAFNLLTSILKVFGHISAKIGIAFQCKIEVAEADIVHVGTITSSPGAIPIAPNAQINPDVQEFTETQTQH